MRRSSRPPDRFGVLIIRRNGGGGPGAPAPPPWPFRRIIPISIWRRPGARFHLPEIEISTTTPVKRIRNSGAPANENSEDTKDKKRHYHLPKSRGGGMATGAMIVYGLQPASCIAQSSTTRTPSFAHALAVVQV